MSPNDGGWPQNHLASPKMTCEVVGIHHYNDVIMGAIASQITSLAIVYSIVYSDTDQRKHQSSASLAFVRGIHRGPVNSPHKRPVTRKMFPFDDVIIIAVWDRNYTATHWRLANGTSQSCHLLKTMIGANFDYIAVLWSYNTLRRKCHFDEFSPLVALVKMTFAGNSND